MKHVKLAGWVTGFVLLWGAPSRVTAAPREFHKEVAAIMTTLAKSSDEPTTLKLLGQLERLAFEERDAAAVRIVLPKLYTYLDDPSEKVRIAVLHVMMHLPDRDLLTRLEQLSGRPLHAGPETTGHPRSDIRLTWRGEATLAGRMVKSKLTLLSTLKGQSPDDQARRLLAVPLEYAKNPWDRLRVTTYYLGGEWIKFHLLQLGPAAVPASVEALEELIRDNRVKYQETSGVYLLLFETLEQIADDRARPIIQRLLDEAEKQKTTDRGRLRRIITRIEQGLRP